MSETQTPRQLLQECLESAVKLAFIRQDLEIDGDADTTQEEIANDAACACFGENTEVETAIPEVAEALKRIECFDDILAALKDCISQIQALCSDDDVPDSARAAIAKAGTQ